MVVQNLFLFATDVCERHFSSLTIVKTNYVNRLDVEDDLQLCMSKLI